MEVEADPRAKRADLVVEAGRPRGVGALQIGESLSSQCHLRDEPLPHGGVEERRAFRDQRLAKLTQHPSEITDGGGPGGGSRAVDDIAAQHINEGDVAALIADLVAPHAQHGAEWEQSVAQPHRCQAARIDGLDPAPLGVHVDLGERDEDRRPRRPGTRQELELGR